VKDLENAEKLCLLSEIDKHFLLLPQRPIVLVEKKVSGSLAPNVAPHNKYLGIFLPYTPLHYLLVKGGKFPALVMTSANISEEPLCRDSEEAIRRMKGIADYFLVHDRRINQRCDDSVIAIADASPIVIRRSRGYAPEPVILPVSVPDAIATGAHLKNTVCLGKTNYAFVSQHIGDLETYETYNFFQQTIQHLTNIFEVKPGIIIHDMHPGYLSTRWAMEQALPLFAVQHHEAHVASCMAEHHVMEEVIGVAFDGTGYGTDGKIWGSEFFVGRPGNFIRCAHFDYVEMAGGDLAVKQPWRLAVAYLYKYSGKEWLTLPLPLIDGVGINKIENLLKLIDSRINCPETCGCGRLFDAVSSLVGLRYMNNYEGQAPMELEMLIEAVADDKERLDDYYCFDTIEKDNKVIISFAPMFRSLVEEIGNGAPRATISLKFHNTIIEIIRKMCERLRFMYGINNVALSGGCFQNRYILKRALEVLRKAGFMIFYHQQVPPNDAGISLGQIYTYALDRVRK
jgi:hydrogenase maturation protein HypF